MSNAEEYSRRLALQAEVIRVFRAQGYGTVGCVYAQDVGMTLFFYHSEHGRIEVCLPQWHIAPDPHPPLQDVRGAWPATADAMIDRWRADVAAQPEPLPVVVKVVHRD